MTAPDATYEVNGAAIRKARMSHGIQMQDLANSAGFTRSYLVRLETGSRRHMRPPTYQALRGALGIAPDDDQLLASSEPTEQTR